MRASSVVLLGLLSRDLLAVVLKQLDAVNAPTRYVAHEAAHSEDTFRWLQPAWEKREVDRLRFF